MLYLEVARDLLQSTSKPSSEGGGPPPLQLSPDRQLRNARLVTIDEALVEIANVGTMLKTLATTMSAGGTGAGTLGFDRDDNFCIFLDSGCRPGTVFSGVGGSGSIPGVSTILVDDKASDTVVFVYAFREGVPCGFLAHAIWFNQQLRF